ncbi:MAG: hypothetical protein ACKORB_09230 [Opitutia bacterium]
MIAQAPADFALKGPMPEVPPSLLASPWLWSTLLLFGAVVWGVVRLARARAPARDHASAAHGAIDAAASLPQRESLSAVSAALRRYVAEVEPSAPAGLSTEELERRLGAVPVLLPARQPLIAALRAADSARFAGQEADPALVAAAAHEAVNRAEAALGAFSRRP